MPKLIVIIGITGNQGHSVATRFLQDSNYRIRGITRNPSSDKAKSLISQGIEIVQGDLNDTSTLIPALHGANLIFSVTNYWEPFFTPSYRQLAAEKGISIRQLAGEVEQTHGRNIADAAATTVDTLDDNGFIVSTLSHANDCSGGEFPELYHFNAKAEVFPGYVREKYPALAAKMSCVHTGYFMTSYRLVRNMWLAKQPNSTTYLTSFPQSPTTPVPHLDVNTDTGPFIHAVSQMPPGKAYMAAGTTCTWAEYVKTWSEVTGKPAEYKEVDFQTTWMDAFEDRETAREIGDMFVYSGGVGYGGGMELLGAKELQEAGIDCPMTSLEDFVRKHDWSEVFNA